MRCVVVGLALATGIPSASAKPRVAFVDATGDHELGERTIGRLSRAMGEELEVITGSSVRGFTGDNAEPRPSELSGAGAALSRAKSAFAAFRHRAALAEIAKAGEALRKALPHPDAYAGLADLHLLAGRIQLVRGHRRAALAELRLARRLAPTRTSLDAGKYPPKVVALYARAGAKTRARARLRVLLATPASGATIHIDGAPPVAWASGRIHQVTPGRHYVTVSARGWSATSAVTTARPRRQATVRVELRAQPAAQRARAYRAALRAATDAQVIVELGTKLAELASADRVIIVRRRADDGALEVAELSRASGSLSAWKSPDQVVAKYAPAPVKAPVIREPEHRRPDPVITRSEQPAKAPAPWYRSTWGKGAIAGVGVTIIGVVVYALAQNDKVYALDQWRWSSP